MFRTFDIVLFVIMTAAATVTYSIKHRADLKLEEVHRLDAEIKLEQETIDLLKADWALLKQPSRLERLVKVYSNDLQLVPTASTQMVKPQELPMLKADLPPLPQEAEKQGEPGETLPATDGISTGSVKR
jgi:hypothetical protein